MPVGELGPEHVVTVSPDDRIVDVVSTLSAESVGSVIVAEGTEPVGIVTDRDIALAVGGDGNLGERAVGEVMSEAPVTLHENDEAMALSRAIEANHVRRIPVVDDDGSITGIVTLDDLVATIGEQLGNVTDTIEAQSPDYSP